MSEHTPEMKNITRTFWNALAFTFLPGLGFFLFSGIGWSANAHAGLDFSQISSTSSILRTLFLATWITALNPCIVGNHRKAAFGIALVLGPLLALLTQGTWLEAALTGILAGAIALWGCGNGFLLLLLASLFGFRRKFDREDPSRSPVTHGTPGGGGYAVYGPQLGSLRISRSCRK